MNSSPRAVSIDPVLHRGNGTRAVSINPVWLRGNGTRAVSIDPVLHRGNGTRAVSQIKNRPSGFTLVELLVVIAIVGLLMALLLPALQASRAAARRADCADHLRQLAVAAHDYHAAHRRFPSGLHQFEVASPPRFRGTSLFAYLLPHLEQQNVVVNWNYDQPLENALGGSQAATAVVLPVLLCPADAIETNPVDVGDMRFGLTSYGGNGGRRSYYPDYATADGLFHTTGPASQPVADQAPVGMEEVVDGTSHTLLLGERSHRDANFATFAAMEWTDSLDDLGRWAAIGGRKRIADVTMSAYGKINFRLPFDFASREAADPPLGGFRDFSDFEDRRKCAYGSEHPQGVNVALVDGSVHFLDDDASHAILEALSTRSGQELATAF